MIKNIVFDMGNVILAYAPKEYLKTFIDDKKIVETVLKELFLSKEWLMLDQGTITEKDALESVLKRAPQYSEYIKKAMNDWPADLSPMEGMIDIVKKLKDRNYKIYLLSNTSLRFDKFKDTFEVFNLFDGFVISAKEKLVKPNPEIYKCLLNRYSLKAGECLFVDDLKANVDAAEKLGIYGHEFKGADELNKYLTKVHIY